MSTPKTGFQEIIQAKDETIEALKRENKALREANNLLRKERSRQKSSLFDEVFGRWRI